MNALLLCLVVVGQTEPLVTKNWKWTKNEGNVDGDGEIQSTFYLTLQPIVPSMSQGGRVWLLKREQKPESWNAYAWRGLYTLDTSKFSQGFVELHVAMTRKFRLN